MRLPQTPGGESTSRLKIFWTKEKQHWRELPLAPFTWLLLTGVFAFCFNPLLPIAAYALQVWASNWNWRDRWASIRSLATPGIVFVFCLTVLALLDHAQIWIIPALIGSLQATWVALLPGTLSLTPLDLHDMLARLVLLLPLAPGLTLLYEYIDPRTQTRPKRILTPADLIEPSAKPEPAPIATPPPGPQPAPLEPAAPTEEKTPPNTAGKQRTPLHRKKATVGAEQMTMTASLPQIMSLKHLLLLLLRTKAPRRIHPRKNPRNRRRTLQPNNPNTPNQLTGITS